jgi:hypothetical protein
MYEEAKNYRGGYMFVLLLLLVPGVIFATTCISSSMFFGRCVDNVAKKTALIELPKIKNLDDENLDSFKDIVSNCDAFSSVAYAYQRA